MPGDSLPMIWELEPHTRAKHQLLDRYLGGWFPILSSWESKIVFLDGFAGPGVYAGGEPGSPRLALERLLDHHRMQSMSSTKFIFLFNEQETKRHASLQRVVENLRQERGGWPKNVTVYVENENFTKLADDIIGSLGGESLAPTFAFLDPFSYKDVPIAKIAALLDSPKCELFIYFDFNSANRFATATCAAPSQGCCASAPPEPNVSPTWTASSCCAPPMSPSPPTTSPRPTNSSSRSSVAGAT